MSSDLPGASGGSGETSRMRRWLWRVRDAWVVIGLALAVLVALELAYRAQSTVRRSLAPEGRQAGVPAAPPAPASWYAEWKRTQEETINRTQWDPYRGWWPRPLVSRHVNIDSLGRRLTPQPPTTGARRQVLMLGGSTMWGFTARDSFTIPALVATALRRRGVHDVEVVNLAQPAFTSTQAAITLVLELRRGEQPAAVVFLDGGNDVATAWQSGRPGAVFNEGRAAERWEGGGGVARHFTLLARLARRGEGIGPPPGIDARARLCGGVAGHYTDVARSVRAIGRDRGFATLFLWQPLLATTHKVTTPDEDAIPDFPGYGEMLRQCTAAADSVAPSRLGEDFVQLAGVFDRERGTVFLDNAGHVTEHANALLAEAIASVLADRLARPKNGHRRGRNG